VDSLPPRLCKCYRFYLGYLSCFHPISRLQRQLASTWRKLDNFQTGVIGAFPLRGSSDEAVDGGDDDSYLYKFRRNDTVEVYDDFVDLTSTLRDRLREYLASLPALQWPDGSKLDKVDILFQGAIHAQWKRHL